MYDILIIGCGPGGYACALNSAQTGAKVAIVEASEPGGTCVNRGCIPSKVWTQAADFMDASKAVKLYGIKADIKKIDFAALVEHKNGVAGDIRAGMEAMIQSRGIDLIQGRAVVESPSTVKVGDTSYESKAIIIATGSALAVPDIQGLDAALMTSDDLLNMTRVPESILVLGSEYIQIEMASILNSLGCKVVMATSARRILEKEDQDVSQRVKQFLTEKGIKILTGMTLASVSKKKTLFECQLAGAKEETLKVQKVLVADRKPNSENLGLENAGVKLGENGSVLVNEYLETNIKGVYALGDVTGKWMLSNEASAMATVVAKNATGQSIKYSGNLVPRGIWTSPEVGSVGLSEEEAEKKGFDVEVGSFPYAINGYAMCRNELDGAVKIITETENDEILGVHIVGKNAVEIVGEAVLAMQLECTSKELAKSIRLHPTFSEVLVDAAKDIDI